MMDRRRATSPIYGRQWSTSSGESMSPAASPAHPLFREPTLRGAGAVSTVKRSQNVAAKVAARRLAQVMANQAIASNDDDYEDGDDDDGGFRFPFPPASPSRLSQDVRNHNHLQKNLPAISVRQNRAPSPALGNHAVSVRSPSAGRASINNTYTAAVGAPTKNSIKTHKVIPPVELPSMKHREQRVIPALGQLNLKDQENQHDAFALYDELDMLQEENERILEMLRHAEDKREEAEARARMLENQVASLGEGVSLEAKLLNRKEEALRRRELALKAEKHKRDSKDGEIATLRAELENLKEEAERTMDQLQEAESEAKTVRTMTQRMILTHEEMEEVVLKRCWLARYWGLAVQYGICAAISVSKHELWSAFAPLPFEVVISAGQKAKDDFLSDNSPDKQNKLARDPSNLTGEGNIESMLSIEMGLRELASLKIEDAVLLAMAQRKYPNFVRDPRSTVDPKFIESYELNQEQSGDVLFKQAWLTYFWNRARCHGVEEDIAEERLQSWISRSGHSPTFHDAVDVERGLVELRKLGIEQQLWEASRKEVEHLALLPNGNHKQYSP